MRAEIRLLRRGVVCLVSLIASPDLLLLAADPCIVSEVNFAKVTDGAAIDNNPNAGGGSRIFAEKTTSAGAVLNQVSIVANIGAAVAGSTVFFRSFDMDDPSSDSAPVDPNMKVGDDNRGAPKNGSLSAASANTDAGGKATVTFTTTKQPGDNFKVAASCDQAYLNGVVLDGADGSVLKDAKDVALPTANAKITALLTVWRKVHIEVDNMDKSADNFVKGTVTTATGFFVVGFVNTNVAGMDPGRFQNGRLSIAGVGNFPIVTNTGNMFTTFGSPGAAANGKDFTAFDDDDFNSNDGVTKKGDTDEEITAPDRSLIQDSDEKAKNLFAMGYVRPVYDLANATVKAPYVANQAGDAPADVRALFTTFDNKASNSDDFWVIYLLGSYQAITSEDQDPDTEGVTAGRVDTNRGEGATTYMEAVSAHELTAVGRTADKLGAANAKCKENLATYKASFRNAETTAHEIGHLFGGRHTDKGLMGAACASDAAEAVSSLVFTDQTLSAIRDTTRP